MLADSLYGQSGRHATWLELFFDLVFVAVIGVVTHDLAHTHHGHIGIEQFLRFPLVFIPVWWIWMTHTLYANRFDRDDRSYRLITLLIMGLMILLSTLAETSLDEDFTGFVIIYVIVRLILSLFYVDAYRKSDNTLPFARDMALAIAVGAVLSGSAILFEGWFKYLVFYVGVGLDMLWQAGLGRKSLKRPIDRAHLVERIGLLAIIILGESVIAMVASLSQEEWQLYDILSATTGFFLIGAIWWIYFDSFPKLESARRIRSSNLIVYTHLPLCMGLLMLANLIRHTILGDLDRQTFGMLAIAGMSCFYLGKQIPYWFAFPPWRKPIVINTCVCVGITIASTFLPNVEYSLIGVTAGMLIYVYLTFSRILAVNVDSYLEPH